MKMNLTGPERLKSSGIRQWERELYTCRTTSRGRKVLVFILSEISQLLNFCSMALTLFLSNRKYALI